MRYKIEKVCGYPAIDKAGTGKRIKKYMEDMGLTVKDVMDHLQLGSVQSIYHWLEGKALPSMDNLFALSILLEVTVDDLICSRHKPPQILYDYTGRVQPDGCDRQIVIGS